jgi:hypothetical protein
MTVATTARPDDDNHREVSLIGEFRRIAAAKEGGVVDGIPVDRFSAANVVAVHDFLPISAAKELYVQLGAERMMRFANEQMSRRIQMRRPHS